MNKITLIHHFGNIGGAGISLLRTVNMLKEHYAIEVYCPGNSDMFNLLVANNIKVIPYNLTLGSVQYYSGGPKIISRTFLRSILNIPQSKKIFINIIKKLDSDIVILNSITICWLAKFIKKYTNKKVICFVRETFPKDGNVILYNYYKNTFLKFCDDVYFISNYDRKLFLKNYDKGVVIRNSVSNAFFCQRSRIDACKKFNLTDKTFNVLFVGGISHLKGTEVIVKAMNGLPNDIKLIIAGYFGNLNDKYSKQIYEYINYNNLNEKIKFIGVQTNMIDVYSCSDVLVFPATKPHQARPVFEAGALKKPVIVSNFPELLEQVEDRKNGLLFNPGDEENLKGKILYLYNHKETCLKLGQANYLHTKRFHSEESVQKVLLDSIDGLLKRG